MNKNEHGSQQMKRKIWIFTIILWFFTNPFYLHANNTQIPNNIYRLLFSRIIEWCPSRNENITKTLIFQFYAMWKMELSITPQKSNFERSVSDKYLRTQSCSLILSAQMYITVCLFVCVFLVNFSCRSFAEIFTNSKLWKLSEL